MTTIQTSPLPLIQQWMTDNLRNFLEGEVSNGYQGGVNPATLSSAIDSFGQAPDVFDLDADDLTAFLVIITLAGVDCELDEIL